MSNYIENIFQNFNLALNKVSLHNTALFTDLSKAFGLPYDLAISKLHAHGLIF